MSLDAPNINVIHRPGSYSATVEIEVLIERPLVVDEVGARREVGSVGERRHRVVLDLRVARIDAEVSVRPVLNDRAVDSEVASRLVVVLVADLVELFAAGDETVIAESARACRKRPPIYHKAISLNPA